MKVNLLTNGNLEFYSSIALLKENKHSLNISKIKKYGEKEGLLFNVFPLNNVDFSVLSPKDQIFLYTSSEDKYLLYKSYIHDVIEGIQLCGGVLIPRIELFDAHHNKVFMEILRSILFKNIDTGISSLHFGTYEEYLKNIDTIKIPSVIKTAYGAGSRGVSLLKNKKDLIEKPRKMSMTFNFRNWFGKRLGRFRPYSLYRNKFVIQNFVNNLTGDFKVLVFADKYYVISRSNRKNDFRASGGGLLNYNPELPCGIFDYAKSIYEVLDTPYASLDIAFDGKKFYLIEFQCLNFGTATAECSERYYIEDKNGWIVINEKSDIEELFVYSIKKFLIKKGLFSN